ncbi:hypothetical protein SUGI_1018910 [Cryptomeria japonica]|uniref:transcription factor MYB113-like n=1 Tax=Cryptomeria japonica TaxID=3369 RepID=UPI0024148805|nr:transcription factor MYB113-like [Cryptomeria japonica]GLJ48263.1 hypothetical protein SUGI_1018910 [Cryptomeria japonica]
MGCTTYDEGNTLRQKKGPWAPEEDLLLINYIQAHGEGRWRTLPHKAGLQRCAKGCRLRWMNYLRPNVKRGNISLDEEDLIIRLHKLLGNRWSLIAGRIPGRTDNEIKNYWNSHLCKKIPSIALHHKARHSKRPSSLSEPSYINPLQPFNRQFQCNPVDSLVGSQRCKNLNSSCPADLISYNIFNDNSFPCNYMSSLIAQSHSNEENPLKSTHFNIGDTPNFQKDIVTKNEIYQHQSSPHNAIDASFTISSQCHIESFNSTVDQMKELYGVRDDLEFSMMGEIEASQQVQGSFRERNGCIFSFRPNNQYSLLPSQYAGGSIDDGANHQGRWNQFSVGCKNLEETTRLTSYDGLLSSLFEDYSTIGFGEAATIMTRDDSLVPRQLQHN